VGPGGPGGPRPPRGPRVRRKGDWWRHWTWKKAAAVVGGVFAFFFLAMFGTYEYLSSSATIPAALTSANYQDTTVYYADGTTVLGTFGATDRQDLTYQQIPMSLQDAVVAAEDKNFWTEGGISPTGILRAAYHDVMDSGDLNGGSTITQEFVRNYYDGVGTQQTASRKIKEIFIAQKVASTYSKQWIMTNFLNLIPMGQGAYGMEAAAETYFGVPVSKLSIAQDAVLAGLIQAPSAYSEPSNRSVLEGRMEYVLQQEVEDKYLTAAQAAAAKFPALLTDQAGGNAGGGVTANSSDPWAPYLLTQVYNELIADGVTAQQLDDDGLKVVTTISRPMEVEMYKAVNENLSGSSISQTSGATVSSLPSWALVGAELQDPKTGEIIAEYPGKGQGLTASACAAADCDVNTAAYAREQVGSSFKPYVLATAVSQGMNVSSSTLDTSPYLCVMPDGSPAVSVPITPSTYSLAGPSSGCTSSAAYKVENDGGELIGKQVGTGSSGAAYYSDNVQDALAQSSNTGFTDLAHKVGTKNIVSMASDFGVNTAAYSDGGSGLVSYEGDVGMALGIGSLTVQEQTTMLATIADNGLYHQAHLIKYWRQGAGGSEQTPKLDEHVVLQPNLDADVQYAMEKTTIDGTAAATVTFGQDSLGTVIGKTGTTTSSKSGFFIGSTTQYTLVVGMFTANPQSSDNLAELGGGGFGGYWPAKIWNSFADAEFSQTPQLFPTNPAFYGTAWNLLGSVPKAAAAASGNGEISNPTVTCDPNADPNCTVNPDGSVTCDPNTDPQCTVVSASPTEQVTCDPSVDHSCTVNPDGSVTCDPNTDPDCTVVSGNNNGAGDAVSATPIVTANGAAAGGVLVLPGSVLLTRVTRRRKRKSRARKAE
jgi:membrane peptidoglycan carboxypeptidase